jgi:hypothetical protein
MSAALQKAKISKWWPILKAVGVKAGAVGLRKHRQAVQKLNR